VPDRTFRADYIQVDDDVSRPYLIVQIGYGSMRSHRVPMIVDTGADACYLDHRLAYSIGINPVDGGAIGMVRGLSGMQPAARFPVDVFIPDFGLGFRTDVNFSLMEHPGMNGLLGHVGFLERFRRVTFFPGRAFELELA